ncbi:hypothetical protein JHD50_09175 [Sulfurimonas sp. MAG313]|nr:hypothetical protein [Sulfurimonas sp. MAG313]MDF1881469.1 hypothetical protein [Sulfurimonas sp. MAG313]
MAIFTAGCIELTTDSKKMRRSIYDVVKHDLDSPAMKVSVRKSPTCINFIAFLPKEKIIQENILKEISKCNERTVVIFELDYKHVGVVCEYQRIVDYILDKPEEFAQERLYKTSFVDNNNGVKLINFNLDQHSREAWAGFTSLGFTILLTTVIFFSGYTYMKDKEINIGNKVSLEKQYTSLVKNEFKRAEVLVKKIDIVKALEKIEKITRATKSHLSQIQYSDNSLCFKVKTTQPETFTSLLPRSTRVTTSINNIGIVQYCYEKI